MAGLWDAVFGDPATVKQSAATAALPDSVDLSAAKGLAAEQAAANEGGQQGRVAAGRKGADFWQGTRQNFRGITNSQNRSNLGAKLGTAHSVMDDNPIAGDLARRQNVTAKMAGNYLSDVGQRRKGEMNEASLSLDKGMNDAKIDEMDRASWVQAGVGALTSGVTGYQALDSYFTANPGKKADWSDWKTDTWNTIKESPAGKGWNRWNRKRHGPAAETRYGSSPDAFWTMG